MSKHYYKIVHGFSPEDYIEIEESEVQRAFYCFLTKKDSVFSGGAIKGSSIQMIKPDANRTMGWNRGYKLSALDFEEMTQKGVDRKMQKYLAEAKERVQYLVQTNQPELVGKEFEMPKLESPVSQEVKQLAEKFKV